MALWHEDRELLRARSISTLAHHVKRYIILCLEGVGSDVLAVVASGSRRFSVTACRD